MKAGLWNANSQTNEITFKFDTEYGFRHTQPPFHNLFIRELDEIDIGSPRAPNEITPAHLGKVEPSEWTTNEVSEQIENSYAAAHFTGSVVIQSNDFASFS